jgi:hypothetical protein
MCRSQPGGNESQAQGPKEIPPHENDRGMSQQGLVWDSGAYCGWLHMPSIRFQAGFSFPAEWHMNSKHIGSQRPGVREVLGTGSGHIFGTLAEPVLVHGSWKGWRLHCARLQDPEIHAESLEVPMLCMVCPYLCFSPSRPLGSLSKNLRCVGSPRAGLSPALSPAWLWSVLALALALPGRLNTCRLLRRRSTMRS